jgi:hypothetical protein
MAVGVFRVSRGKHHSSSACSCSYCHSSKAYPGKKRIEINRGKNVWCNFGVQRKTNSNPPALSCLPSSAQIFAEFCRKIKRPANRYLQAVEFFCILFQRSRPDSNWCRSFCRAQPSHSATGPFIFFDFRFKLPDYLLIKNYFIRSGGDFRFVQRTPFGESESGQR